MVLTILSLLFTQQANRTIIKRAAYYTSNLYDPNIKTFNRVNYEAGFDINFLHNRLGLVLQRLNILHCSLINHGLLLHRNLLHIDSLHRSVCYSAFIAA